MTSPTLGDKIRKCSRKKKQGNPHARNTHKENICDCQKNNKKETPQKKGKPPLRSPTINKCQKNNDER